MSAFLGLSKLVSVSKKIKKDFVKRNRRSRDEIRQIIDYQARRKVKFFAVRANRVSRQDRYRVPRRPKVRSFRVGEEIKVQVNGGWYMRQGGALVKNFDGLGSYRARPWLFVTQNIFKKGGGSKKKTFLYSVHGGRKPSGSRGATISRKRFTQKFFKRSGKDSIAKKYLEWGHLDVNKTLAPADFRQAFILKGAWAIIEKETRHRLGQI